MRISGPSGAVAEGQVGRGGLAMCRSWRDCAESFNKWTAATWKHSQGQRDGMIRQSVGAEIGAALCADVVGTVAAAERRKTDAL